MEARTQGTRFASAQEAEAITALVESAYRGTESRAGWTSEADLVAGERTDVAQVRAVLTDPACRVLVLDDEAGLLATCEVRDLGGGLAYFGTFAVRPRSQGAGVGRCVVAAAEECARREFGARTMEMTVLAQRDVLLAWYERQGYVRTGETRPFPTGPRILPQRDDLFFLVLVKELPGV